MKGFLLFITVAFISYDIYANVFSEQLGKLNNKPTVGEVKSIVDHSRYCYRRLNTLVYKGDKLVTGLPLFSTRYNNNSEELENAIKVIRRSCF